MSCAHRPPAMPGETPPGGAAQEPPRPRDADRSTRRRVLHGRRAPVALALLLGLTAPLPAQSQAAGETPPPPAIIVSGEGRIEAAPDMASLRVGVVAQEDSPGAALAAASDATRAMLERMTAAGIATRDLQTSDLTLNPVWRYDRERDEQRLVGFEASNLVTVRVRDLALLGRVLDEAVTVGANRFDGLQFGLSEAQALTDEARRRAVTDALRKARLYAEAAGVSLGPVLRIVEEGASAPMPPNLRGPAMAMDAAVPVAEGELEIAARVTLHFGAAE